MVMLAPPSGPGSAEIERMVRTVVTGFNPEMVVLFGSYARGEAGPNSDVDLLVVMDVKQTRRRAATEIDRALAGRSLPLDLIVVTPEDVRQRRHSVGTIIAPALDEGRILYQRDA